MSNSLFHCCTGFGVCRKFLLALTVFLLNQEFSGLFLNGQTGRVLLDMKSRIFAISCLMWYNHLYELKSQPKHKDIFFTLRNLLSSSILIYIHVFLCFNFYLNIIFHTSSYTKRVFLREQSNTLCFRYITPYCVLP